jgi:uncharacterized alpha-E superfamily protein
MRMLLSRVAERLYWMGRLLERAEDTARIVNVNAHLLLDLPKGTAFGWEPLLFIIGAEELFYHHYQKADETSVVKFMLVDRDNPRSILSSLHCARENLRTTRDIVPRKAWEKLNDLYQYAQDPIEHTRRARYAFLTRVIEGSQLISGLLAGTMSRDQAYDLVRIGRNLERTDMTSRIIDIRSANLVVKHTGGLIPFASIQWMSVLKSLSAYQMYRRHIHARVNGTAVLRFLLQDPRFPRSVYHCLGEMQQSLNNLPHHEVPWRHVVRLRRQVHDAKIEALIDEGLHGFIDGLQIALGRLHDRIQASYFLTEAQGPRSSSMAA